MSTGPNISAHDGVSRRLEFVAIDKKLATELVVANHYLHRECPISWSWGIEVDGETLGVLTIGKPMWSVRICSSNGLSTLRSRGSDCRVDRNIQIPSFLANRQSLSTCRS
jgi:hypothetical protein